MRGNTIKVIALFFVGGVFSGFLTLFIGGLDSWLRWVGLFMILLPGLAAASFIATRQGWIDVRVSAIRYCIAILIIILSYPLSLLVLVGVYPLYDALFRDQGYSAPNTGFLAILPFYLAAMAGACFVSLALWVLTHNWQNRVFVLMVLACLVTIPLGYTIATMIDERNWQLVLFPVGEALTSALCGYWLLRTNRKSEGSCR